MCDPQNTPTPWQCLQEITQSEHHFNTIESKYRALVSTWLLATFGGMGFIATADLPFPQGSAIFAIALAGSLGVQLIWVVDLLAYHHLLSAYFLEGLRIEARHPELPQVRWNMWQQGIVERRVKLFYSGCALAPLPFGGGALLSFADHPYYLLLTLLPLILTMALWNKSHNAWLQTEVEKLIKQKQNN
jgi:hypothetical protein